MKISTFDNIMRRLRKGIKSGLQPGGLLKAARRTALTGPGGVEAARETLLKVEKVSQIDCTDRVKVAVANAIVDGADPVDTYFSNLPTPEQHESLVVGGFEAVHKAYMYAYSVFCTLMLVYGMDWVHGNTKEDPILAYLWQCATDTAVTLSRGDDRSWGWGMYPYLLGLVWDTGIAQGTTSISQYSTRTQNLLNYFGWVILGRKDITCMVNKPLGVLGPMQLRTSPNEDLSRLPGIQRLPGEEGVEFSRLARLFQIAFNQFQISTRYNTDYFVLPSDGVVKIKTGLDGVHDEDFEHLDAAQNLDLSQPVARAALHYCACSDIGTSANCLLEFFFREFCHGIELLHFVPRNVKAPMVHEGSSMRFNMEPFHMIAVLIATSGFSFALDPSGDQYGWVEILAPFHEYARCRIDHVTGFKRCRPVGSGETLAKDTPMPVGEAERDEWISYRIAEEIHELAEVFVKAHGGFDGVLELPGRQFNDLCLALEASLRSDMRARDEERNPDISSDSEDE